MARFMVFVALGLLCLISGNHAAPKSSQESSEEMGMKGFVERLKLLALTLSEFSSLHDEILEKGTKIFEEVLKDPKVADVKTEAMQSQTKLLQDYLDKLATAKKDGKKSGVFELVDEYDDVVNKFDSNQNELTPEGAIIEKSLDDHGLGDIAKTIQTHFENFLTKFSAEVEPYINGLNEEEKKSEKKFIDWYEKVKAEKDTDKKVELFDEFFED